MPSSVHNLLSLLADMTLPEDVLATVIDVLTTELTKVTADAGSCACDMLEGIACRSNKAANNAFSRYTECSTRMQALVDALDAIYRYKTTLLSAGVK